MMKDDPRNTIQRIQNLEDVMRRTAELIHKFNEERRYRGQQDSDVTGLLTDLANNITQALGSGRDG